MTAVPTNVDFIASAAASTAKARFVPPTVVTRDALDVATALKCMSVYQTKHSTAQLALLDDENEAAPLIAAARTLQSTAQHLERSGSAEGQVEIDELYFHAAIAFAMHGNFPSAKAALSEVSEEFIARSQTFRMAAAVCDPSRSLVTVRGSGGGSFETFRQAWYASFTRTYSRIRNIQFEEALNIFVKTAMAGTPAEVGVALNVRIAALQAHRLSIANLADEGTGIPAWFVGNALDANLFTLLPPQRVLLADKRIAAHGRNTLLTLPTSTGKTLIAQACIAAGIRQGGLFVYVAPYVAIGEQVRQSLDEIFRNEVPIVSMFGGFKAESLDVFERAEVLIATPERFDAWLRAGVGLDRLRTVVLDEIHILENGGRGARVEGVVSRLRLLQRNNPRLRLVGLSAVLTQPEGVRDWLGVSTDDGHEIGWRPTARRLAMCMANGDLHWVHGTDSLRPSGRPSEQSISQPIRINLPGEIKFNQFPAGNEKNAARNVAAIAVDLHGRLGFPGLVVCPRKVDTRLLARTLAGVSPDLNEPDVTQVAQGVVARYPWLKFLSECLLKGIAYHNAALPFDVRRDIEWLTRRRHLRVVCATTTLAEGADLPFRWTIVAHWLMSMRDLGTPMKSMTFRNIAGRCGRAGAFSEGDTVLFENLLGPPARFGRQPDSERLRRVMFTSSPLESTIGPQWEDNSEGTKRLLEASFASQLLACISEHPDVDGLVAELVGASYSARCGGGEFLRGVLNAALATSLDASLPGGALAVANSPIRLTEFGKAANRSGFSPTSCRRMVEFLSSEQFASGPVLFTDLLRHFNQLPEQPSDELRKIFSGATHRNAVKDHNLAQVFTDLFALKDVRVVFDALRNKNSKAQEDYVETQFENFVSFVDTVIVNFLPWLLRGFDALKAYGSAQADALDWSSMAGAIERSLSARADADLELDTPEAE